MTSPGGRIELAQVWVPIMPEASRIAPGVERIGRDVSRRFGAATRTMGSQMATSVDRSGRQMVSSLQAVEKQTAAVARARAKDADAAGRVRVAQAALADLSRKSTVTTRQRVAAEEALSRAQRAQQLTANALARETRSLNVLQSQSRRSAATEGHRAFRDSFIGIRNEAAATGTFMESSLGRGMSRAASFGGRALMTAVRTATTAAAGITGIGGTAIGMQALQGGFNRLKTIEDAKAAMNILMQDTDQATEMVERVTALSQGTPYTADQFLSMARTMYAMGVSADRVAPSIEAIANGITASGLGAQGLEQVSMVFGKMASRGKLMATDLNSMAIAGIPALKILANQAGVTAEEMSKTISETNFSAEEAIDALTKGIMEGTSGPAGETRAFAGVLQELRDTVSGSLEVWKAQRNILGATFLSPLYERLPGALNSMSEGFKSLRPAAEELGTSLAEGIERFIEWVGSPGVQAGLTMLKDNVLSMKDAFMEIAPAVFEAGRNLGAALSGYGLSMWSMFANVLKAIAPLIKGVTEVLGGNTTALTLGVAAWAAWTARQRLLVPLMDRVSSGIGGVRNMMFQLRGPLRDVTDRTSGLVTQTGLLTAANMGTLGPLGQMRMAYLQGAQQAGRYAREQQLVTTHARQLQAQMVGNLGPINRVRHAFSNLGQAARSSGRLMGAASAAGRGLSMAGQGLMGLFGGPVGLALTGATLAFGALATSKAKAAQKAEELIAKEKELQSTLDETTGKITESTRQKVIERLREEDEHGVSVWQRAADYGIDQNLLVDAATGMGDPETYARLRRLGEERIASGLAGINTRSGGFTGFEHTINEQVIMEELAKAGVSRDELTAALLREGNAWEEVDRKIRENVAAGGWGKIASLSELVSWIDDSDESYITLMGTLGQLRHSFAEQSRIVRENTAAQHGNWEATEAGTEKLRELGAEIKDIPTGKELVVDVLTDEGRAQLEELGFEVQNMEDGEVKIVALTDEAEAKFLEWVRKVESEVPTASMDLDTSKAREELDRFFNEMIGNAPQSIPIQVAPSLEGMMLPDLGGGQVIMPPGGATGGRVGNIIRGPGTGTSDSILARTNTGNLLRVSNGESINTEASTRRNWPLIDAMNKGWVPPADLLRGLPGLAGGGRVDGLNPGPGWVKDLIQQMYPQVGEIGGWRPEDGFGEHSTGNAIDVMIPDWQTPYGKALGDQIAGFMLQNADALGLTHVIWQQRLFRPGDRMGSPMEDRGNPTQNHYDHVHAFFNQRGGQLPTAPVLAPGGGLGAGSGGMGGSRASNAARRRVQDAQDRVDDAAFRIEQAERRLSELSPDAKESQRAKAERDLVVAQREHQQALEALAEAEWEAAEAEADNVKGSSGRAGGPDGRSLGRDIVSGLLEAVGLDGDIFSNPLDWGIWKLFTGGANYVGGLLKNAFGGGDGMLRSTYPAYMGSPSSAQHGRGLGSPGPGNYGVGDGGLGGVDFADPGSAVGDTLSSLLPQVSDFLPNSQDPGPQQQQVSSVHYDQRIQIEGAGVGMKELGNEMNRRMNPQRTGYAMNVPGFRP